MATAIQQSTSVPSSPITAVHPHSSSQGPVIMSPNLFRDLVCDLSEVLGPYSGLDSAEIDHEELMQLMRDYKSARGDWSRFAHGDYSRPYTRNLVDKGNGKSNLLILVWTPGKGSPIHDHADAHCIMKILQGNLRETLYDPPAEDGAPQVKKVTDYSENQVTYMSDDLGLHRVENPDPNNVAVSLHLYTPPHAATRGCHIFDGQTGKATHVKQCEFFTEYGCKAAKKT